MSNKFLYVVIGVAIFFGVVAAVVSRLTPIAEAPKESPVSEVAMCTADAMLCPDGSYVGRTGEKCEFICPPTPEVPEAVQVQIDAKADFIKVQSPTPLSVVQNPLIISGQARGNWFFEATAPVALVDWDGKIIAQGIIKAEGDWMTTEFVPFTAELSFLSPYKAGDQEFMKRGALIFKKDNPSGLPENDNSLEIPIAFSK